MKTLNKIIKKRFHFLVLLIIFSNCADNSNTEKPELTSSKSYVPQTHLVEIKQMAFVPAVTILHKGDSVKFINSDILNHDISEDSSKLWSSSTLQPRQNWTREFTESANYFCSLHPVMKGKVLVKL